jgi:hypothetical protein
VAALVFYALLMLKRFRGGGELGGSSVLRWGVGIFVFALWIVYLILSGLQANDVIGGISD